MSIRLKEAAPLLSLLPKSPESAISMRQIASRWSEVKPVELRAAQRYMKQFLEERHEENAEALVERIDGRPPKYYLKLKAVGDWLMTEQMAINLLMTQAVVPVPLGASPEIQTPDMASLAAFVATKSVVGRRLSEALRVVPDGLGRVPAKIPPEIMGAAITALTQGHVLSVTYTNKEGRTEEHRLSPRGLIGKDGTIYLISVTHRQDTPITYAMHRVLRAECSRDRIAPMPFDIDEYLRETQNLSHRLGGPQNSQIELRLRVAPEAIFHFRERPLSLDQVISIGIAPDTWFTVTASTAYTMLLVPFLLSMGHWIEVLEPEQVRKEVAIRAHGMAAHYPKPV